MTAKTPEEILTYYADAQEKCWARKFEHPETLVPVRVLREAAASITTLKRERDEAYRKGHRDGAEAMRVAAKAAVPETHNGCCSYDCCGDSVLDNIHEALRDLPTPDQEGGE